MPRKVFFSKLRIVHNFSSRRGGDACPEAPTSPLSPRTPGSCSSDGGGDNSVRRRARQRQRKLATGGAVPRDIPQGCMAVYVGRERKRFVISTHYLNHHLFKALLKRTEEEFGFEYRGGLHIACEAVLFEHLLWLIGSDDPAARTTELEDLLEFYDV
ncbi:SAUR family protein [Marchantia polymorpha subsp. ruderalis]|uniref:Uncharacterized protein n=2 Tax=Marchantia polymorpha TaxID=3197 RepID=A0AAF6BNP7_MARPO|nr:hypothetical protein MARPO_0034s0008 [Marchantia polymorpha]BBN13631.1 hypothetical protein Mp_6g05100 [Marchantia polymorpha subsp. ruderalis]|eukprot:PTQ41398.1 hypothetical protein MARPO_0034s0008 [Marchantia polymorpha]